jgi:hypothetical protein
MKYITFEHLSDSRKFQMEKTSQPRVFGKREKTSRSTEENREIDYLNFLEQTWRYINETRSDINSLRWKNNMVIIYYCFSLIVIVIFTNSHVSNYVSVCLE